MITELSSEERLASGRFIEDYYRSVAQRMADIPVYNDQLSVELIGWQNFHDPDSEQTHWLGILITPWSMQLWAKPDEKLHAVKGDEWALQLPAGECTLIHAESGETGRYASASLLSSMTQIAHQDSARTIAGEILQQLMTAEEKTPPEKNLAKENISKQKTKKQLPESEPVLSRRSFLTGRSRPQNPDGELS